MGGCGARRQFVGRSNPPEEARVAASADLIDAAKPDNRATASTRRR
jgi:hypothetical protein